MPDAAFVAFGAALFAWRSPKVNGFRFAWFAVFTPAFIYTVRMSQWPTFITAAGLLPWLGFLLACKPTVGAAMWVAFPNRKAVIGGLIFAVSSLTLLPTWPALLAC